MKRSAPPRSAVCAPLLGSIAKKEEELKMQNLLLTQAKDEVISRLIAGERVFTEGKRSRIPVTPRMDQRSPPTSSPASYIEDEFAQSCTRTCIAPVVSPHRGKKLGFTAILQSPFHAVDKWTQTELVKEATHLPRKV